MLVRIAEKHGGERDFMAEGTHATGTRLVGIATAQRLLAASADGRTAHLLTTAELAQAEARRNPAEYVAGHLAAKRAAIDALERALPAGTAINPLELETTDAPSGAPVCTVTGHLAATLAARNMDPPRISITNEAGVALATAVVCAPGAEGENA